MNVIKASQALDGDRVLEVVHGDLTREAVDAVVNAANGWLAHGGGVAGAILRRGGLDIQLESDAWVERHGKVPTGGVAVTTAGMLPARRVVHAVGPVWHSGDKGEPELLREAVANSLEAASDLGAASIALPAISSGIFGFPKERCAEIMVDATLAFFAARTDSSLRRVRFTNIDTPTVAVFLDAFAARFAGG
ncbi:MAG: macro domain-containing protein [Polyangiales bacterium]